MGGNYGTLSQQLEQGVWIGRQEVGVIGGAIGGTVNAVTKGDDSYSGLTDSLHNLSTAIGGTNQDYNDITNPPTAEQVRQRHMAKVQQASIKQQADANKNAMGFGRVANYGYGGNMSTVTPPSQLMAISDPNAKMALAGAMGSRRNALRSIGAQMDLQAHSSIAMATGASDDVNPMPQNQQTGTGADVANGSHPPVPNP